MISFFRRLMGTASLLPWAYEDVEADPRALPQALVVVLLSSLATGSLYLDEAGTAGLAAGVFASLGGWLCWSWLAFHIGSRWLAGPETKASWGELLRTTGFASSPGIVRFAGLAAHEHDLIMGVTTVWMLAAFVLAVRQALDFRQTWRAVVVCLAGWLVYAAVLFMLPQACRLAG